MKDLKGIECVRLYDYSGYEADKSSNGGCYGFWTDYHRVDGGWEVSYGTTADFSFCCCCGSFGDSCGCGDDDFEVISTGELEAVIRSFEAEHVGDDDYYVEYKEG